MKKRKQTVVITWIMRVLCGVLLMCGTVLPQRAEEEPQAPGWALYDVSVNTSDWTVTVDQTYYRVTVFQPEQEYLIIAEVPPVQNENDGPGSPKQQAPEDTAEEEPHRGAPVYKAFGTDAAECWTVSSGSSRHMGGISFNVTSEETDYTLRASDAGLELYSRSRPSPSATPSPTPSSSPSPAHSFRWGEWKYENSHLYYVVRNENPWYLTFDGTSFGCSAEPAEAASIYLFTAGPDFDPCIQKQPDVLHFTADQMPYEIEEPAIRLNEGMENFTTEWTIGTSERYYSTAEVKTALETLEGYGVWPVVCRVTGKKDGIWYGETSWPVNYIHASGILDNSFLTFSDVHMEFSGIGQAIQEIMEEYEGKIPSLILNTGDWDAGISTDETYCREKLIAPMKRQAAGIDMVYVAGNHEGGEAASKETWAAGLGADESFLNNGYGVIFRSDVSKTAGTTSRQTGNLAIYGISYMGVGSTRDASYLHILDHARSFLETTAKKDPNTLVVFSAHAGVHRLQDWQGSAMYNIRGADQMVDMINEMALKYQLDVVFLFGHDHSRNEKEFLYERGSVIPVPVDPAERTETEKTLCFTLGHAGYMTSARGGTRHYSLYTWNDETIHRELNQLVSGDDEHIDIRRLDRNLAEDRFYTVKAGDGSSWEKGSGKTLPFTIVRTEPEVAYEQFDYAELDGVRLEESAYDRRRGGLILDLHAELLEGLSEGTHSLNVSFKDGRSTAASFTVTEASPVPAVKTDGSSALPAAGSRSPDTDDHFSLPHFAGIEILALTGIFFSLRVLFRYR